MPGERGLEDFDIRNIPSIRRNPLLADMCERLKIMERRGSGFKKIFEDYLKNFQNPAARTPSLESRPTYFRITLPNLIYGFGDDQLATLTNFAPPVMTPVATPVVTPVVTPVARPSESLVDEVQRKVLLVLHENPLSTAELSAVVGISQPKNLRRRYLRLLLDMELIEYTIPQKPNSRLQKYRLTLTRRYSQSGATTLA